MRKLGLLFLAVLCVFPAFAQPGAPGAERILADTKQRAAAEHKNVFLVFGASWCGPCHRLDRFLDAPEISAIIQKYFLVIKLRSSEEYINHPELNTPGAEALVKKLGGEEGNVPFMAFVDSNGKLITNSNRMTKGAADGGNIGYPETPEEIDWFMSMLRKAVPSLPQGEAQLIENWLAKSSMQH